MTAKTPPAQTGEPIDGMPDDFMPRLINRMGPEDVAYVAILAGRLREAKRENMALPKKWFDKGRDSVLRKNDSGCCCKIDEDGETILSPCAAHKAWAESQLSEAQKKLEEFQDHSTSRHQGGANSDASVERDLTAVRAKTIEQCAKVCDEHAKNARQMGTDVGRHAAGASDMNAYAIRALGLEAGWP